MRKWFQIWTPFVFGAALVLATGAGAVTSTATPDEDHPDPRHWPENVYREVISAADRLGVSISSALFDALDEVTLYTFTGGSNDQYKTRVRVEREVFDNFDLLNTYTVIDRARVKLDANPFKHLYTLDESLATPSIGMPYAGVIFTPQASIDWTNVRQVKAVQYRDIPPARAMRAELERASDRDSSLPEPDLDPNLVELNPYARWYTFDPSQRPRFNRLWNLLAFPFRMPFSAAGLKRLAPGEVVSYSFTGLVEVGGRVGWKVIPDPQAMSAGLNFSLTGLVEGTYRISVLKENERFARVKLTRVGKAGRATKLTVGYERKKFFKGFLLFKGSSIEMDDLGAFDLKVVPFEWETKRLEGDQFDVSYRYDLENDEARDAFHRAVLGSFVASDEIASRTPDGKGAPVTLDARRFAKTDERRGKHGLGISFLIHHGREKKLDGIEARIELPDGEHRVFKSVSENSREWTALFGGNKERISRKFTVVMDQDRYERGESSSLFVIAEAFSEDLHTRGKELNRTIDEIERFFGRPDLFPEMPIHAPDFDHPGRTRRAWYGKSSFYWGFNLGRAQIESFLGVPETERAKIVSRVFPPDDQLIVLGRWNEAARYRTGAPKELYGALKALFNDRRRGRGLMHLVRNALPNESIDYFVDAQNSGFPTVHERGKLRTSVDDLLTYTDQQLGHEGVARRAREDTGATVSNLRYLIGDDGLVRLRFTLDREAKYVYLRLSRRTGFKPYRTVADLIYANVQQRFKVGPNEIVLDPESMDRLTRRLSESLRYQDFYEFSIGYSREIDRYGPPAKIRFQAPSAYEPPEPGQQD